VRCRPALSLRNSSDWLRAKRGASFISALPIQTRAIRCQLDAITDFAIKNDTAKLPIRAALRDALDRLERKEFRGVTQLETNRRRLTGPALRQFSDDGSAA
jgi:hypothetical protein